MFNGMMDPELMRLAQEQMSRLSPADLAQMQQQMMSNPDLIRMATESMKNMKPEDLRNAAEQLKYARSEDMAEVGKKLAGATPEEIASMSARADAHVTYELNAAQMLKKQGNDFHSQGRFNDAAEKYLRAKNNLKGLPVPKVRGLQLTCSLNLMSCYLKTRQYNECIEEGSEVLQYDSKNVKALYRRGQAYKELGQLKEAVPDLYNAHTAFPDDETIADVLRDAKERLSKESGERGGPKSLQNLKNNPEAIRSFQNFISNADPDTLAALNPRNSDGMSPDMIKTASNMISKMSPEELQKMVQMASSFQGSNPFLPPGTAESNGHSRTSGSLPHGLSPDMMKTAADMMKNMPPNELQKMFEMANTMKANESVNGPKSSNWSEDGEIPEINSDGNSRRSGLLPQGISPEMLKTASDMMSKMPPDELQKMFEMASTLKGNEFSNEPRPSNGSMLSEDGGISSVNRSSDASGSSSSGGLFPNWSDQPSSNLPTPPADFQDQMRNQMNDPAMRQMLTSMIKNMNPDMMASMSEKFGFKLSREQAEKAQQAMSSVSPDHLDTVMRWLDRAQRGLEAARKTKNWLLGRSGMILAICMLILAIILHRLGYIGM
ncbi:hypothetical protein GIB67_034320 [Kingdonia uniflora]|uniref:Outer envelope protein 61 n=1 Tax=Kingdonia uniflora TaxID=39325 RepID=A0A7J7NSM7_9MAGN|nr:hypothetical protein GIB67_034320 [Kingdonia uniflora]